MKNRRRSGILPHLAILSCLSLSPAQATPLTWDANGTGTGQTNGGGAWLGADFWWNGFANPNWVADSDATFGGPNTAGGTVTLASPTTVGSITFNTFTGTYKIITGAGGLTKNGSGRLTLGSGGTIPAHNYAGTTTLNGGVTLVSNYNIDGAI